MKIRRQFISDTVKRYIEQYPEEYEQFMKQLEYRRAIANDKRLGKVSNEKELRVGLSLPERLMRVFQYVLKEGEKRFGEEKGEMKWFAKKFPQFLLPYEY